MFCDFSNRFEVMLNQAQKLSLIDVVVHELNKIKKVLNEDSQKAISKAKKPQQPQLINIYYQAHILMKTYLHLIKSIGMALTDKFLKYDSFTDTIILFLTMNNLPLQVTTAYTLLTLVQSIPKWRTSLLSLLLNHIAIVRSDIVLPQQTMKNEVTQKNLTCFKGYVIATALLIRNVNFIDISIPFDLANTIFEIAKSN